MSMVASEPARHPTRRRRHAARLVIALAVAVGTLGVAGTPSVADTVAQPLPLGQDWSDRAAITVTNDWSGVPGIIGYRGDGLASSTGVDPQTVVADGAATPVNVIANQTNPATLATGGVAEFDIPDPVVALQGSGTARAPHLVASFSTSGTAGIHVAYDVRDIDASADNAVQPVALQYRVGGSGTYTNVPAGFVADASSGPSEATLVTHVEADLPAATDDQPLVNVRVLTTDAAGSDEWVGIDNLAITATGVPSGPALPVATCPATLVTVAGTAASAPVSATDADSTFASIAIASPPVDGITLVPIGPGLATLTVDATTAAGAYPVTIAFTTADATPQVATCVVAVSVLPLTPIHDVQGDGATSPLVGEHVAVDGVVTATISRNDAVGGAFVQEPDADADTDPSTSEGVYVFCAPSCPPLADGEQVQVTGVVAEFPSGSGPTAGTSTEIDTAPGGIVVQSSGNSLPTAVRITLPASGRTDRATTFEAVESMLTTIRGPLTVSEFFQEARFGQIVLVAGPRPFTYTQVAAPSVAGNAAYSDALAARRIVLDDGSDDDNDAVTGTLDEPYPYPTPGLSVTNRFRAGDTIDDLTGVMQWAFGAWRERPLADRPYTFTPQNVWPSTPPAVAGRLKLAGFNVLNYFASVDTTASDGAGDCGPTGGQDCRGADSEAERLLQLAKIVASLKAIDADVFGLTEIQNDTGAATQQIVDALNAVTAPGRYDYVRTGTIGGDAIKVAFLYKSATVTPVGPPRLFTSADDPRFIATRNRPPIIQTFAENATGERFTAAINHLKSKGSACDGDPDRGDGAGNCNVTRTQAAVAESAFLATDPTGSKDPDVIVLGDLNSYPKEDPIRAFEAAGYVNLVDRYLGNDAYSYLFDGTIGYLDHALANRSMAAQVTDVGEWHSNADENPLFDYNDTIQDAGEAPFERESAALPLSLSDPRRASDHDPVIVGLSLASLTVDRAVVVQSPRGGAVAISGTIGTSSTACPPLSLRVGPSTVAIGPTARLGTSTTCVSITARGVVVFDLGTGAFTAVLALPSSFTLNGDHLTFALTVDGTIHAVVRDGRRVGNVWTTG
jgi:predicted extracellular nuclease